MPAWLLGIAAVPAALVPMKFPWITVPVGALMSRLTKMPHELPDTTFRPPSAPPMVLLLPPTTTPSTLGTAAVPSALVPTRLLSTTLLAPNSTTPSLFPEITFRGAPIAAPIAFPSLSTDTPVPFARALEPAASVPR